MFVTGNVLILKHGIDLDTHNSQVSEEKLLNLVGEILSDEDEYIDVELIKRLADGIIVDLKFERLNPFVNPFVNMLHRKSLILITENVLLACSITDFELTPELAIFASLKIPLYHGWLVDPQVHHFDCVSCFSLRKSFDIDCFSSRIWKLLLQLEADLMMI